MTTGTVSASSYAVIAWSFSAGAFKSMTVHKDGTSLAMDAAVDDAAPGAQTPENTSGILRIAAQEYSGTMYNRAPVNIAEIIIYNSALSDANREAVENYLLAKWGVAPAPGDPYFASVSLLLHMEGSESTFVDSSSYTQAITTQNSPTQTTSQYKFGTKSGQFGSGTRLNVSGDEFAVGTGDFTAEAWVRVSALGDYRYILDTRNLAASPNEDNTGFILAVGPAGQIWFFSQNDTRVLAGSMSVNTWHHVAVCRASGVTRVFLDGTQVGSSWTNSANYTETSLHACKYGHYLASASDWFVDELRWTNAARYTANFTPPTAAFPDA
jgi:hypothetical protein